MTGNLLAILNAQNKTIEQSPVAPEQLVELLRLVDSAVISGKIAKTVFDEMVSSGKSPKTIVEEKGLVQITDGDAITQAVAKVLAANAGEVAAYRVGKTKLFGFFVGQVMKETRGKANPQLVNDTLKKMLEKT
jgi:aspartyl-tRNA(Asn)/glutamyl-tRNA(Gln) amidotransferase subunit B